MRAKFDPSGPLKVSIRPPADKSISHRAAMVAGMCDSPVTIRASLSGNASRGKSRAKRSALR